MTISAFCSVFRAACGFSGATDADIIADISAVPPADIEISAKCLRRAEADMSADTSANINADMKTKIPTSAEMEADKNADMNADISTERPTSADMNADMDADTSVLCYSSKSAGGCR